MTHEEKRILRGLFDHQSGLASPAELTNGIARGNHRAVEHLIALGYVEEVPRDIEGVRMGSSRTVNFYRVTDKTLAYFGPWYKWLWLEFVRNSTSVIGLISIIISVFTLGAVIWQSSATAHQANLLQKQIDLTVQPFLVIVAGNEDGSAVTLKNVGSGVAKDVFALKHSGNDPIGLFSITHEGNVGVALPAGSQGVFNLNSQAMATASVAMLEDEIPCVQALPVLNDNQSWIAVLYKDLYDKRYASIFLGQKSPYDEAVELVTLSCQK